MFALHPLEDDMAKCCQNLMASIFGFDQHSIFIGGTWVFASGGKRSNRNL